MGQLLELMRAWQVHLVSTTRPFILALLRLNLALRYQGTNHNNIVNRLSSLDIATLLKKHNNKSKVAYHINNIIDSSYYLVLMFNYAFRLDPFSTLPCKCLKLT